MSSRRFSRTIGTTYVFRDVKTMNISMSAVGDTRVILFETERITTPCHKVCFAHMQFVRNLLTVMSQKTVALKQKLRILSQRTIRGRLMLFLQIRGRSRTSSRFRSTVRRSRTSSASTGARSPPNSPSSAGSARSSRGRIALNCSGLKRTHLSIWTVSCGNGMSMPFCSKALLIAICVSL